MSLILFLSSFALYLSGLCGTIPVYRDSGDLIAAIHTLGIAHPPGYAFYVILGKAFELFVPFGNVAYRVNVLSAVFAAGAVAMLFKAACTMTRGRWVPAFAASMAVLFATSPAMISLARVAEMYTMEAFFAAAILLCLFSEHPRAGPVSTFLLGLGLSVHPTLIFLAPLFFIFPARTCTRAGALAFLSGLTVFLYLPIRAAQHPLVNWGDPSHWRNFWRVVTRADYGGLKLHPEESTFSWSAGSVWAQMNNFVATFNKEWGWGALLAGACGVIFGIRQKTTRRRTAALLAAWLLAGPAFFLLSNLPLAEATTPAILQPYLLLAGILWSPFVMQAVTAAAAEKGRWRGVILFIVVLLPSFFRSIPQSERHDYYAYDYARNLLRSLPAGAVLFDPDDPTRFSVQVLQTVEGRRPDVALLNFYQTRWGYEQIKTQWPDLLPPIPMQNARELERTFWAYSARRRPFFAELPQKLGPIPYRAEGLVYGVPSESWPIAGRATLGRAESLLAVYVKRGDYSTVHHADFFTRHLIGYYAAAQCNLGLDYAAAGEWDKAVRHYQAALEIDPELSAAYNNWGIVAYQRQDFAKASELFEKALARDAENENLRKNAQLALQKMRKLI